MYAIFNRDGTTLAACHDETDAHNAMIRLALKAAPLDSALARVANIPTDGTSGAAAMKRRAEATVVAAHVGLTVGRARNVNGEWVPMLHA